MSFASVELGSVVFLDAGWVGDRVSSNWLDNAQTSTGVGFRFGSAQLLGSPVVRLDIAQPLNDRNGKSYTPTFSIAVGQVFGFNP